MGQLPVITSTWKGGHQYEGDISRRGEGSRRRNTVGEGVEGERSGRGIQKKGNVVGGGCSGRKTWWKENVVEGKCGGRGTR